MAHELLRQAALILADGRSSDLREAANRGGTDHA
jgi:hypothetical protein